MLKTLMNFDPIADWRAFDEMFDRMLDAPLRTGAATNAVATLPVDILERQGHMLIRAAVPGVNPQDLDVSIENGTLTIRGEMKQDETWQDAKVYRREYSYGRFARSIRLPEKLDLDKVDAEFANGFVTISIPLLEETKPKALKVNIRAAESALNERNVPREATEAKQAEKPAGK